jgi:hypothetical protein
MLRAQGAVSGPRPPRQGQEVRVGDVLLRLDAEPLDNEIADRRRVIQAARDELARSELLAQLTARQFEAVRAKAEAGWQQAREEIYQPQTRRASDTRLARGDVEAADDEEARLRLLVQQKAASEADLVKVVARLKETQ